MQVKIGIDLALARLAPKSEALTEALELFKSYFQIALPSGKQTGKIEDIAQDKSALVNIKNRLNMVRSTRLK